MNAPGLESIDFFCGAGGSSWGLREAGFRHVLAIDRDPWAELSYRVNFQRTHFCNTDLSEPGIVRRLLRRFGIASNWAGLAWLSPPCQGWSDSGPQRRYDPRRELLFVAVDVAKELPSAFLCIENVRGLLFRRHANRPGALFDANIADLTPDRIVLPPGNRTKKNGTATIPNELHEELKRYVALRSSSDSSEPLFVSPNGGRIFGANISKDFKLALVLAFVRQGWSSLPAGERSIGPLDVAQYLLRGRHLGFDGVPPKDKTKIAARAEKKKAIEDAAAALRQYVESCMRGADMYALRKTHVSWARRLVNSDSVKLQVGHAPQDIEERHYLDLVDPRISSQAVWDVLMGKRDLSGKTVAEEAEASSEKSKKVAPLWYPLEDSGETGGSSVAS